MNGMLSFSGKTNNVSFPSTSDMPVIRYYDLLSQSLTVGQLARTDCSNYGTPIVGFIPPHLVSYYEGGWDYSAKRCSDPYDAPSDAAASCSPRESIDIDYETAQNIAQVEVFVPYMPAVYWNVNGDEFGMTADMGLYLKGMGLTYAI